MFVKIFTFKSFHGFPFEISSLYSPYSSVTIANIPGLNTIIDTKATGAPSIEGGGDQGNSLPVTRVSIEFKNLEISLHLGVIFYL